MEGAESGMRNATFSKSERLCSRKSIEALFGSGSRSLSAYPIRALFREEEREGMPVEVMMSVSKRHFKHAVDRNRVKRLLRESYRRHKYILWDAIAPDQHLALAFLWQSKEIPPYKEIEGKVQNLLVRIAEKLHEKA